MNNISKTKTNGKSQKDIRISMILPKVTGDASMQEKLMERIRRTGRIN